MEGEFRLLPVRRWINHRNSYYVLVAGHLIPCSSIIIVVIILSRQSIKSDSTMNDMVFLRHQLSCYIYGDAWTDDKHLSCLGWATTTTVCREISDQYNYLIKPVDITQFDWNLFKLTMAKDYSTR